MADRVLRRLLRIQFEPWWAQRQAFARATESAFTLLITGRQTGKTQTGAWWLAAHAARTPGRESCLLVPTYRLGVMGAETRLRRFAEGLGARWSEKGGVLTFPNGHKVWVRSADRPDATRGLPLSGWLWIDEGPLISRASWEAVLGCMVANQDPHVLISGTPKGQQNWVYELWRDGGDEVARVRFRSGDSPIANQAVIRRTREALGAAAAAQELDAEFLANAGMPFPPEVVERLFADALPRRGDRFWLGVDLAKERDYTVCTLMNEFGEAWIVGRWRHVAWPDTEARIAQLAEASNATLVLDIQHGGGYGGALADYLERSLGPERLVKVKTGTPGVKAEVMETLARDCEYGRLRVDASGPHADVLRLELLTVVSTRYVVRGTERIAYEGPVGEDEHDDCVISLALANWGRDRSPAGDLEGDYSGWSDLLARAEAASETIQPSDPDQLAWDGFSEIR